MGRAEGHGPGGEAEVLWRRWEAMKKGKSRMRARGDILRFNVANARRRARKQAAYDRRQYDKPQIEES
jgi:hypothetical protein